MCWKWPPFASRQDWTCRAIFCKVLASMSTITAWISLMSLLSRHLWFVVCSGKFSLSDIPRRHQIGRARWPKSLRNDAVAEKGLNFGHAGVWSVGCSSILLEISNSEFLIVQSRTSHASMAKIQSFFSDRIISKGLWPPCSPDLTPPAYFLCGYLKGRVYQTNHEP